MNNTEVPPAPLSLPAESTGEQVEEVLTAEDVIAQIDAAIEKGLGSRPLPFPAAVEQEADGNDPALDGLVIPEGFTIEHLPEMTTVEDSLKIVYCPDDDTMRLIQAEVLAEGDRASVEAVGGYYWRSDDTEWGNATARCLGKTFNGPYDSPSVAVEDLCSGLEHDEVMSYNAWNTLGRPEGHTASFEVEYDDDTYDDDLLPPF